ncbi:DctP family TRAP transporter solute-binding subunit [Salibacterium sp. K-3]
MKKTLLKSAASLALIAGLTACGGGEENGSENESASGNESGGEESENSGGESDGESSSGGEASYTIEAGIGLNNKHPQYEGLLKFKEIVEEETDGDIKVDTYHSGQLGDDREMMEALQLNTQEVTIPSTAPVANFVEEFTVFDFPFLFPNEQVADKVLDGEIGTRLLEKLKDEDLVGLAYWENGYRDVTNSTRPIESAEDFEGLTLRTMENDMHIDAFEELGANPTPMAFGELFTAMQQGTVDGQENPIATIYLESFYEVQDYYTDTHHVYSPFVFMMSKQFYDSLPDDYQTIVKEAAVEAGEYQREQNRKANEEMLADLEEEGMEITKLSDEARQEMADIVQPVIDEYSKQLGEDFVDEVYQAVEDAQESTE